MAELLDAVSEALVTLVKAAGSSVVRIEARERLPGSGVVWSDDGLIVTANHVVEREDEIRVGLPDGATAAAELLGRDPGTDLALLRAKDTSLNPLRWADGDALQAGALVLALGRPGQTVLATLGIVSALDGAWRTPTGGSVDRYVQTDAVMYPGFSGGPLIAVDQRILGLNTSALGPGLGLTIPTATVRRTVEALLAHGRVRRGYLGVAAQPVRLPAALSERLGQDLGLLLMTIEPDSPAEKSGLYLGDILVGFDGQRLRSLEDLLGALGEDHVGVTTPVRIVRGGQVREMGVTLGERTA